MNQLRIGLTGGLASGKSAVAGFLREAGYLVVDADEVVASLYEAEAPGAAVVFELFGGDFLDEAGAVDRPKLAAKVFADDAAREHLEELIHPLVALRFYSIAKPEHPVAVLEATLLAEAGLAPLFDLVVTVEADPEARIARAVARGLTEEAARARLAAQGDGEERRLAAGRVIQNDGDLDALRKEVDTLVGEIEAMRNEASSDSGEGEA